MDNNQNIPELVNLIKNIKKSYIQKFSNFNQELLEQMQLKFNEISKEIQHLEKKSLESKLTANDSSTQIKQYFMTIHEKLRIVKNSKSDFLKELENFRRLTDDNYLKKLDSSSVHKISQNIKDAEHYYKKYIQTNKYLADINQNNNDSPLMKIGTILQNHSHYAKFLETIKIFLNIMNIILIKNAANIDDFYKNYEILLDSCNLYIRKHSTDSDIEHVARNLRKIKVA